eukprot:gene10977-12140_t
MPGLLAKGGGNMESPKSIEENSYCEKKFTKVVKTRFLSPSHSSDSRRPSKGSSQDSSDGSSLIYSPNQDEQDENTQSSEDESNADFSDNEVSFKKPAVPKSRGRKRKSSVQQNEEVKKPRRQSTGRNSLAARKKKKMSGSENDEETLFDIVKGGRTALRAVLDDWIDNYNEDREGALVDLIQFFVQCCGCKGKVTREMIEAEETVQAIRQLTELFDEDSHEYPLIATGPASKKFKNNISQFIELLIGQCQNSIIYDEIMMDTLISWIIGLSDSQVRAFRHTSTFAGMKTVTAIIDVALKVSVESDNTQRQLDSENRKSVTKRSREQIEMLQRKREDLKQNVTDLQEMMNRLFAGVFVHRYRDVRPEIRSICIAEIGVWMKTYSTFFGISEQTYTKYVGWTLYDKIGEVRLKALHVLLGLYEDEECVAQLELFTNRFKDRIVKMTFDKENDVAVEAIRLVCLFFKHDILEEEDAKFVEQLVFCDQKSVAQAAGEFLKMRLFYEEQENATVDSPTKSPRKGRKGNKKMLEKQSNMKNLVDFFISSEIHDHAAYLVDSLWEHTTLLKDWPVFTNILLDINSQVELNDQEETCLIEIMTASCRQAALGHGPSGRAVKKAISAKDRKQLVEDRHSLSSHFMETLPFLLAKFESDSDKALNLMLIPQCFELEVYAEKRLTKHLEALLQHIEDIVLKHASMKLLETCAKSLQFLCDNDLVIQQTAEIARNRLIDQIVEKFHSSVACGIPADIEDKDDPDYYSVVTSLKRIAAFYKPHDLRAWGLQKDLHGIIEQGLKDSLDEEIFKLSLSSMHTSILWSLVDLDPSQPSKSDLKALKKRLTTFISQLCEVMQHTTDAISKEAFLILSDLLVFFARQLQNKAPLLTSLVYEADSSVQIRMRDYVMSRVFATVDDDDELADDDEEDDKKAVELNEKRTILAAFCKLIIFNIFDMTLAAPMFAQLIRAYSEYSDIIKHTMAKAKEINAIAFVKTLLTSLKQAFEILREEQGGDIDKKSDGFRSLKDLARRFALMLGVNTSTDSARKCTLTFHREGIVYALANAVPEGVPPNLAFLEVLHELTYRLNHLDRRGKHGILPFLNERIKKYLQKTGDPWTPLMLYRNGIMAEDKDVQAPSEQQHDEMEGVAQSNIHPKSKRGSVGRGRAKKKLSLGKAPAKPGHWMNAKRQEDSNHQAEPVSSRLADEDDSSEEEATRILQRRKRSEQISVNSDESTRSSPRNRGRPKDPAFQIMDRNINVDTSQTESPDQADNEEESSDVDFVNSKPPESSQASWLASQPTSKHPKQPKRSYASRSITPAKRGRSVSDIDDSDDQIEEDSSENELIQATEVSSEAPRKRQKREFPNDLFQETEEPTTADPESSETDLPSLL